MMASPTASRRPRRSLTERTGRIMISTTSRRATASRTGSCQCGHFLERQSQRRWQKSGRRSTHTRLVSHGNPRSNFVVQISCACSRVLSPSPSRYRTAGQNGIDGGGFQVIAQRASTEGAYLYVQFESLRKGYIDDMEFAVQDGRVNVRTSSRLGYLDLGVNAKRYNW